MASDESGSLRLIWFGQPFRPRSLREGEWYHIFGNYDLKYRHLQVVNPKVILVEGKSTTGQIMPVYPETKGLKSWQIQRALTNVRPVVENITDPWPTWLKQQAEVPPYRQTLLDLHFPTTSADYEQAQLDLGMRELVELSLSSQLLREANQQYSASKIKTDLALVNKAIGNLGFELTKSQQDITFDLLAAMAQAERPLNRLLQGDVGSGKTVVAALLALNVLGQKRQVAFMAPTEILAKQHYETLEATIGAYLPPKALCLLTASQDDRQALADDLATSQPRLVVGTHALFADKLKFGSLDLVIIDEQHRFGVKQRQKLIKKADLLPHVLSLSATPIPRSLALVLYGELDIHP